MPRDMPGDIRIDPLSIRGPDEQPLGEEARELVRRAYALFEDFQNKEYEIHQEMADAREMRALSQKQSRTSPLSNTLNSCIDNVIADQVDNMPEAKMVPEREETANSAEEMSDIVAYVLYQANFPREYQHLMEDVTVTGTGVMEVYWDDDLEDGEGMCSVACWHPEDFYPDPMYENIQDGRACFKATQTTVAWVEEHYPDAKGYIRADSVTQRGTEQLPSTAPDGDERTTLIEYWYKRYDAGKRKYRVHMAQLAGRALLYSTELGVGCSEREYREGVYAHGQYPFVVWRFRRVWRKPFGTGLIHDYAGTQNAIDRYIKYIDDNARMSAQQRMFIRKGSGVDPDVAADMSRQVVEWEGNNINEIMMVVQARPLNPQVFNTLNWMVDTMKQDCGQNQFSRGEGGMGVTAASAIQALQEAGGKITRMHTESYKTAFREMVEQIMWVMSEYIDDTRVLRIVGGWDSTGNMNDRLVQLHSVRKEGDALPKPAYTVRVQVQKNNPLQIQSDNEFVTQVAQICAQYGAPLPPEAVISLMEGVRTKSSVLRVVAANSQKEAYIKQLEAQVTQMGEKIETLNKVVQADRRLQSSPSGQMAGQMEKRQQTDYSPLLETGEGQGAM